MKQQSYLQLMPNNLLLLTLMYVILPRAQYFLVHNFVGYCYRWQAKSILWALRYRCKSPYSSLCLPCFCKDVPHHVGLESHATYSGVCRRSSPRSIFNLLRLTNACLHQWWHNCWSLPKFALIDASLIACRSYRSLCLFDNCYPAFLSFRQLLFSPFCLFDSSKTR